MRIRTKSVRFTVERSSGSDHDDLYLQSSPSQHTVDSWQLSCVSLDEGRMRFLTDVRHFFASLRCAHLSFVSRLTAGYPVYQEIIAPVLLRVFLNIGLPGLKYLSRFVTLS
jgi:hypothetical protein